jgi:hypothetical protein
MTSSSPPDRLAISPRAAAALEQASRMAIVTDEHDETLAATRSAAIDVAKEYGLSVVLYDRSQETWMDTPHPSGPCDRSQLDERARGHLNPQLDEFERAGVEASTWVSTVPTITEIVDVISELGVDLILLPNKIKHPKLLDRLKAGRPADVVENIAAMNLEHPVPVLVQIGNEIDTVDETR